MLEFVSILADVSACSACRPSICLFVRVQQETKCDQAHGADGTSPDLKADAGSQRALEGVCRCLPEKVLPSIDHFLPLGFKYT